MASRTIVRRALGGICRHPDFGILSRSNCGPVCSGFTPAGVSAFEIELADVTVCEDTGVAISVADPNGSIITSMPPRSVFIGGEYLCAFFRYDLDPSFQLVRFGQEGKYAGVAFYRNPLTPFNYIAHVSVRGVFAGQLVQDTPFDVTEDIVFTNLLVEDNCGKATTDSTIQVAYGGTATVRRARPECRCKCETVPYSKITLSIPGFAPLAGGGTPVEGPIEMSVYTLVDANGYGNLSSCGMLFPSWATSLQRVSDEALCYMSSQVFIRKIDGVCTWVISYFIVVVTDDPDEYEYCWGMLTAPFAQDDGGWPTDPEEWTYADGSGECAGASVDGFEEITEEPCDPCDCAQFYKSTVNLVDNFDVTHELHPCWYRITGLSSQSCVYLAAHEGYFGIIRCFKFLSTEYYEMKVMGYGVQAVFQQTRSGCMGSSWSLIEGEGSVTEFEETDECHFCDGPCQVTASNTGEVNVSSRDGAWSVGGVDAYITTPYFAWASPPTGAYWISHASNNVSSGSNKSYTTTISICGTPTELENLYIPIEVMADNKIEDVLINGSSTGVSVTDTNSFNSVYSRYLPPGYWLSGDNTIEVQTYDDGVVGGLMFKWGTSDCSGTFEECRYCKEGYQYTVSGSGDGYDGTYNLFSTFEAVDGLLPTCEWTGGDVFDGGVVTWTMTHHDGGFWIRGEITYDGDPTVCIVEFFFDDIDNVTGCPVYSGWQLVTNEVPDSSGTAFAETSEFI